MMRHLPLLAMGLLCGLMIALVVRQVVSETGSGIAEEPVPAAVEGAAAETGTSDTPALPPKAEARMQTEEVIARIKRLETMAEERRQREQMPEKTREARTQLQFSKRNAWKAVLEANREQFEALRAEAAQSPEKLVPCTICDAKGVLDLCVICDRTGKCPTCQGDGRLFDAACPTCDGRGKCFYCFGSGRMPCPYCQSQLRTMEMIAPNTPEPPAEIPIN